MMDYKEMYFKLFRATEKAVNILLAAQRECEEAYIAEQNPAIYVLPPQSEEEQSE